MNPGVFGAGENLLVTFLASFLVWLMMAGVFALWFFVGRFKWRHLAFVFFATFVAWGFSELIKEVFPTIRPFEAGGAMPLTLTIPNDASFPSAHASMAFAMAVSLRKFSKKVFFLYFVFAVLVGLGRVLGHVHYSVDILGGAAIGILTVILLEKISSSKLFNLKLF